MANTFEGLKSEYENLWATMQVCPDRADAVHAIAGKLLEDKARYQAVERSTGVPWFVIAAWHNRESDADFSTQLAQGDPLDRVSVNEPDGRGPFDSWEESAHDALVTLKHLDQIQDWTPARICYETERYNGFGYRNNHPDVKSPYLWSFTNHYSVGKYVSDGRFSATAVDKQCGAIPIMKRLMELSGAKVGPVIDQKPASGWLAALVAMVMAFFRRAPTKPPEPPAPTDLAGRVVSVMKKRGMRLDTGSGQVNIVYIEGMGPEGTKNDNPPNQFNDARFVIGFDGAVPRILGAWEATTEPGNYWTEHRMNPGGAFHIALEQQTAWVVGTHHAGSSSAHEALVQHGVIRGFRDPDETGKRDLRHPYAGDDMGINQHWGYDLPKNDLGTSSAGCLVGRMKTGHRQFMALVKSDPRYIANNRFVFTAAVLPASEV